ncbi:DNA polymerase alpha catalytic subunit, partial [Tanacetum coccineum]
ERFKYISSSYFVIASEIFLHFGHQIHPVVSHLCASIEGTSPSMLADCLGLDPSKFQSKSSEVANNDHSGSVIGVADDEERCMTIVMCIADTRIVNLKFVMSWLLCCDYTTLSLNLRVIGDSERGIACPNYPRCNGRLVRQYSEPNVLKQLYYFCYLLDANRFIDKKFKLEMILEAILQY